MDYGTVLWFDPEKRFGFIRPDAGGDDIFVHATAVRRTGLTTLAIGKRVSYDTAIRDNRRVAVNVASA